MNKIKEAQKIGILNQCRQADRRFIRGRYGSGFREIRYEVAVWPSCYENLRYGPIGEIRAESPATGPASLDKYKKREAEASLNLLQC